MNLKMVGEIYITIMFVSVYLKLKGTQQILIKLSEFDNDTGSVFSISGDQI
jgi:hypothetical protein